VGRPITDLVSDLNHPTLEADVRQVLRTLVSVEQPVAARDGRWFNVRIMPYRTQDDRIDGVVITFADITVSKTLEAKLRGQPAAPGQPVAVPATKGPPTKGSGETATLDPPRLPHEDRPEFTSLAADELRQRAEERLREQHQEPGRGLDRGRHPAPGPRTAGPPDRTGDAERGTPAGPLEMEAGLEKYSDLYDFAPVGYLSLDRDGTIREANLAVASLLGIERCPTACKRRFGLLLSPADAARLQGLPRARSLRARPGSRAS
jgi:PAS domain-containing protein